jgi:Flp pilus assembly protein TadD
VASAADENRGVANASSKSVRLSGDAERVFKAALSHHQAGRAAKGESLYQRTTRLAPDFPPAWSNLGVALRALNRHEAAVACLTRAVSFSPDDAAARANLGNAFRSLGRLDDAVLCHRAALKLSPEAPGTHYNFALVLRDSGDIATALRHFERAEQFGHQSVELQWDRALAYLVDGDLVRGFAGYEGRWRPLDVKGRRLSGAPWGGEPLEGRTILVYAEQGFGDTIQFARYVPVIAQRAGRVVFECQPRLFHLFSGSAKFDNVELIQQGDRLPEFDLHAPLLTLFHLVGTTLATIPADIPYLFLPPWDDRLLTRRSGVDRLSDAPE